MNHRTQARCLIWKRTLGVLYDAKIPLKLKEKFIEQLSDRKCCMEQSVKKRTYMSKYIKALLGKIVINLKSDQ